MRQKPSQGEESSGRDGNSIHSLHTPSWRRTQWHAASKGSPRMYNCCCDSRWSAAVNSKARAKASASTAPFSSPGHTSFVRGSSLRSDAKASGGLTVAANSVSVCMLSTALRGT
eukprot:scaffold15307_cov76-Phaeocystis_antarctica.AAC.1